MQYFKPADASRFVGDCMPFFHDGIFHLYYLLDENHHAGLNGRGGHQWAHSSSRDLIHWTHHPLAVPLGAPDDYDSASICTGSLFFDAGIFYAFYAARSLADRDETICVARSEDGITFEKDAGNPIFTATPPYTPKGFRDPVVFRGPDDRFHMLICALEANRHETDAGCFAHYTSTDLQKWEKHSPFVSGLYGNAAGWPAPECPDYFEWNDHFYILWGHCGDGRTHYLMADQWNGPWRAPADDTIDTGMIKVMKSASFGKHRRIGVAFLNSRQRDTDDSPTCYAGQAIFRELVQERDGTLSYKFPLEMIPPTGPVKTLASNVLLSRQRPMIAYPDVGSHVRIRATVRHADVESFGLLLRADSKTTGGYVLAINPSAHTVVLRPADPTLPPPPATEDGTLRHVPGLGGDIDLDVILKDDIIDICVNQQRTLCLRLPQSRGGFAGGYMDSQSNGTLTIQKLTVASLL